MKQLEAIRKQNYQERKLIKQGHDNQQKKKIADEPKKANKPIPDPRFDPEVRKKKIEAFKVSFRNCFSLEITLFPFFNYYIVFALYFRLYI